MLTGKSESVPPGTRTMTGQRPCPRQEDRDRPALNLSALPSRLPLYFSISPPLTPTAAEFYLVCFLIPVATEEHSVTRSPEGISRDQLLSVATNSREGREKHGEIVERSVRLNLAENGYCISIRTSPVCAGGGEPRAPQLPCLSYICGPPPPLSSR